MGTIKEIKKSLLLVENNRTEREREREREREVSMSFSDLQKLYLAAGSAFGVHCLLHTKVHFP